MAGSFMSDLAANLIPAVLAGTIGGLGAYVAVKVDIAVLMSNQASIKEDLRIVHDVSDKQVRMESRMDVFQYQLDALREAVEYTASR